MAPDEYKCANELPFLSAKGSAVLMLVNLAVGNSVNPDLGHCCSGLPVGRVPFGGFGTLGVDPGFLGLMDSI
jgi:hypothetical protein